MTLKPKYVLTIVGVITALMVGLGLSPRAISSRNDIIFGENGPIKIISPDGAVLLTNSSQTITSDVYIQTKKDDVNVKRYAFFILDLNDGFPIGEGGEMWLGVELKASTNNFGMIEYLGASTPDGMHPCYWSCTESDYQGSDDSKAFVISSDVASLSTGRFKPGGHPGGQMPISAKDYDNRGWVLIGDSILEVLGISSGEPIDTGFKFPRKIGVLVGPEMLRSTAGNTDWLRSDNEEIVWSYMRTDVSGYETNVSGKAIWTMCEPSCWFKEMPKWANHGVNTTGFTLH